MDHSAIIVKAMDNEYGMTSRLPVRGTTASSSHQTLFDLAIRWATNARELFQLVLVKKTNLSNDMSHSVKDCGKPIVKLLFDIATQTREQTGDFDLAITRLDDLIALATEKFYAFPFKDVPSCWRILFREVSLLKVSVLSVKPTGHSGNGAHPSSLHGETLDEIE